MTPNSLPFLTIQASSLGFTSPLLWWSVRRIELLCHTVSFAHLVCCSSENDTEEFTAYSAGPQLRGAENARVPQKTLQPKTSTTIRPRGRTAYRECACPARK